MDEHFCEGFMAKLYFRYGTVGSAKTLNLVAVAHNYRQQGKKIFLLKPDIDNRFGKQQIKSRAGLGADADILVQPDSNLLYLDFEGISCLLVDEAQFLSKHNIDQLRAITLLKGIPVICYGLRTDFKGRLFEGAQRLFELADSIEEVKATCHFCNRKSIMNLRYCDGKAVLEGPTVLLGAEERYLPACFACYISELQKSGALSTESITLAQS
jgi:thymidine kinase